MPSLVGGRTPIICVAELNLDVRPAVHVVGQRRGGDGLKQEVRFHPRRAFVHGKVGRHRCAAGRCGTRTDIQRQLGSVRRHSVLRHATVVGGPEGCDDDREVGRIGASRLLRNGGDVEGESPVARKQGRRFPVTSVSTSFTAGFGPELVAGIGHPRSKGTVPKPVHVSHVGLQFSRAEGIGGTLQIDARLVDGVACRVIHWEPQQQA